MDYINRHSTIAESEKAINNAGDTVEQYDWIRSPVLFREDIEVHGDVDLINGEYKINGVSIITPPASSDHEFARGRINFSGTHHFPGSGIYLFPPLDGLLLTSNFSLVGTDEIRYNGPVPCYIKLDAFMNTNVVTDYDVDTAFVALNSGAIVLEQVHGNTVAGLQYRDSYSMNDIFPINVSNRSFKIGMSSVGIGQVDWLEGKLNLTVLKHGYI